jgi:hypothetical protein
MKTLTEQYREILKSWGIEEDLIKPIIADLIWTAKLRDSEVFGWLYTNNPNPDKTPETTEEIEAANNEKVRIAQRMEETI